MTARLNRKFEKQAEKIDILCNDLIVAQKDFIKRLRTISFAANFYESIIGMTDLSELLCTAGRLIKDQITDANVIFFLRGQESASSGPSECRTSTDFELHLFESDQPILLEKQGLENCFSLETVDNICKSNKICALDDMFAMGLQGNLNILNKICWLIKKPNANNTPYHTTGRSIHGIVNIIFSGSQTI